MMWVVYYETRNEKEMVMRKDDIGKKNANIVGPRGAWALLWRCECGKRTYG